MGSVLTEFVNLLTGGITGMATGIGQGLSDLTQKIFLTGTGTENDPYKLSVYGGVIAIFGGVALAVALSTRVVTWITSIGN